MIAPNKGVEYSGSVDQYKLIAGFLMVPFSFYFMWVGRVPRDLLDTSSPDKNCSAKRFVSVEK